MHLKEGVFLSNLNNLKCFENKPHIAVGVSGGPDSMALVYILNKWIIIGSTLEVKFDNMPIIFFKITRLYNYLIKDFIGLEKIIQKYL